MAWLQGWTDDEKLKDHDARRHVMTNTNNPEICQSSAAFPQPSPTLFHSATLGLSSVPR